MWPTRRRTLLATDGVSRNSCCSASGSDSSATAMSLSTATLLACLAKVFFLMTPLLPSRRMARMKDSVWSASGSSVDGTTV